MKKTVRRPSVLYILLRLLCCGGPKMILVEAGQQCWQGLHCMTEPTSGRFYVSTFNPHAARCCDGWNERGRAKHVGGVLARKLGTCDSVLWLLSCKKVGGPWNVLLKCDWRFNMVKLEFRSYMFRQSEQNCIFQLFFPTCQVRVL